MAFSDLQQKVIAEKAVEAMKAEIAPLKLFATSYNSEIDGMFGQAVAVPTIALSAGEFDASTNNLEGTNEFGGEVVTLDKDFVSSVRISDKNLAYTGIDFSGNAGAAIGKALGRAANAYTIGLINSTNCTVSANFDATNKTAFANLVKIAYDNDIPVKDSVVLVNPTQWAKILGAVADYSIYGSQDIIKTGVVKDILGFAGIACTTSLESGTVGAIVPQNALATVSLYCPPVYPESFAGVWKGVDDENGLAISMTEHSNTATGYGYIAGRVLFGAKLLYPGKVIRLV